MPSFDVVIVGNGAVGLALGLSLARWKSKIVVIGEPHRPWGASAAAGAMLGCFGEVTAVNMQSDQGRARVELAFRARNYWPSLLESLKASESSSQTANGTIVLLNSAGIPNIDDACFEAIVGTLKRYDEPYEEVDPREVEWLDCSPAMRPLRTLHIPGEHAVDATRLLGQMQTTFTRKGGVVQPGMAESLDVQGGKIRGLTLTSGERIAAPVVVLAAGAATQRLLDAIPDVTSNIPRLISGFGTSILLKCATDVPSQVIRTPNRSFGCGLHMVPRGGTVAYIGASNIIQPDLGITPVVQDVASLLGSASKQLHRDFWFSEISKIQTGNRPVSLDGFPLIGKLDIAGLWLATATNRDGLHLSPYVADQISQAIHGRELDPILNHFKPHRRPIEPLPRDEAIESAALQTIALGYEGGWNVPHEFTRLMHQQMVSVFKSLADRISEKFVPAPEILSAARNSDRVVGYLQAYYASAACLDETRSVSSQEESPPLPDI